MLLQPVCIVAMKLNRRKTAEFGLAGWCTGPAADMQTFNASSYSFFNMHPSLTDAVAANLSLEGELESGKEGDADECNADGLKHILDNIGLSEGSSDATHSRSAP
jgi:hypothetical protein